MAWKLWVTVIIVCIHITRLINCLALPENEYASNWSLSTEQCKHSQPSTYLLGDFNLNSPHLVCSHIPSEIQVFGVGVTRHIYTSIDKGIHQVLLLIWFFKLAWN